MKTTQPTGLMEIRIDVNTLYHIAKARKQRSIGDLDKSWNHEDRLRLKEHKDPMLAITDDKFFNRLRRAEKNRIQIEKVNSAWRDVLDFCDKNIFKLDQVADEICNRVAGAIKLEEKLHDIQ